MREQAVTIEKLRELYDATPFQPFVIHLADGRQLPVHHRDFMMAAPSGRTIVVMQPDDSLNIIDVNESVRLSKMEVNRFVFSGFRRGSTPSKTTLTAALALFALAVIATALLSIAY